MSGLVPLGSRPPASLDEVLGWCEQGKQALVEAETVTRAHDLLGVASTLEHAVKARDLGAEAVLAASALRVRAERRVGQLLREQPKNEGAKGRGRGPSAVNRIDRTPTLAEQGLSKNDSATYQRLAAVPDPVFEEAVEAEQERAREQGGTSVTRAAVLRAVNPEAEMRPDEWWLGADKFTDACRRVTRHADVAIKAARFGHYPGDEPEMVHQGVVAALTEAAGAIASVRAEIERRQR